MYIRRIISVLAAAVSVGVCVFITYISRDVDLSTLIFNLTFLGVMLVMVLAACFVGIRRLMQVNRGLRRGIVSVKEGASTTLSAAAGSLPLFQNAFLDDCYRQYRLMSASHPDTSCDIQSYINEDSIETYVHRGILELVPDILTSLGILGTFVGLVMGLRSFDPSGYEQMAGSVTPLINGIKVAFITSIYGISLSLAFSFNLRSEFAGLSALVEEFLDTYYLNVRPPYEVDSLSRLLEGQKSREEMTKDLTTVFVEQMGKSFEEVITPAYERMSDGISRVVEAFTESQTQVIREVCESVVGQVRSELNEDFSRLSDTIHAMEAAQNSYTDFIDRSMTRMQQSFVSLQDDMTRMNQYNEQTFATLNMAQQEAMRINQDQKATYQDYIRFMYQSIEKFSEVWDKNSEEIQRYTDEIGQMGPVRSNQQILDTLNAVTVQLRDIQKRQHAAELSAEMREDDESQKEMLARILRRLEELTELVDTPRLFRSRKRK